MTGASAHCLWPLAAELGEGPLWHAAEQRLYFVDIKGRAIHRCAADGSARRSWPAPRQVGFVQPLAVDSGGGLVAGLQGGLHRFVPARGSFELLRAIEPGRPGNRLNDACVDGAGRLWFGSMDDAEAAPSGSLYSLSGDGELSAHDSGIAITNGPCTSPDGRTLYHTDTLARAVHAFDLGADGRLGNKRLHITLEGSGWPDGSTVDAEGCLWVAVFGGWRVDRYSPRGERLSQVGLPCANVTKIAFGGADLRSVFVTTACKGLSAAERAAQPQAGGLFGFRSLVPGLPARPVAQGCFA